MDEANELLDVKAMAALLGMAPETVRIYSTKKPERLPPRLKWSPTPLWARVAVEAWISERDAAEPGFKAFLAMNRKRKRVSPSPSPVAA